MNRIYLENVNLSKLRPIKGNNHQESTLFHDKTTAYKLFNDLNEDKRERKQRKIELLGDGNPLLSTIMPRDELFYHFIERFEGCSMDYIDKAKTLYKAFAGGKKLDLFLQVMGITSHSFETIHSDPRNIVLSDVHAENIIVDRHFNPYIVDIDSCKVDGIRNDVIPLSLKYYLLNRKLYTSIESVETTPNTDRLCFLMMVLGIIFRKHIDNIDEYEYDEKTEQITILRNMKEVVLEVKKSSIVPEVPYFHEIIKDSNVQMRKLTK